MINIHSSEEIGKIRSSGQITAKVMQEVLSRVAPGADIRELDAYADELIRKAGGEASFKRVPGYHWATCMNINDVVVHGIPVSYKLKDGDRLGLDMGTYYEGFHSDASWSVIVGTPHESGKWPDRRQFLKTGEDALKLAVSRCVAGNHIGDLSDAMQSTVEGGGYSCVRQLVGHGVGRELHEDPEIPCYVRGKIENTPEIKPGMVVAIEVIYNMGGSGVVYINDDGWTIGTKDMSLSGLFEHTIAVTDQGPEILTALNGSKFNPVAH